MHCLMVFAKQKLSEALLLLLAGVALLLALCIVARAKDDEKKNASPLTGAITGRVVNEMGSRFPMPLFM